MTLDDKVNTPEEPEKPADESADEHIEPLHVDPQKMWGTGPDELQKIRQQAEEPKKAKKIKVKKPIYQPKVEKIKGKKPKPEKPKKHYKTSTIVMNLGAGTAIGAMWKFGLAERAADFIDGKFASDLGWMSQLKWFFTAIPVVGDIYESIFAFGSGLDRHSLGKFTKKLSTYLACYAAGFAAPYAPEVYEFCKEMPAHMYNFQKAANELIDEWLISSRPYRDKISEIGSKLIDKIKSK